jgi:hypothetical protein
MTSFLENSLKRMRSTTNFSTSYNLAVRNQIIREAQPLLRGHLAAREIWHALQVADFQKEGTLNDHGLQILFQRQGRNIKELLQVKNPEELLSLLDEKGLGFLSEDEQILMFSLIKERMTVCASELCKIYEYGLEKEMLHAVKLLENDIIDYQNTLRKRMNERELNLYKAIGSEKLENFEMKFREDFESVRNKGQEKIDRLKSEQAKELLTLDDEFQKDLAGLK